MIGTDELLLRHTLTAMDKILRPAATVASNCRPQERSFADGGTAATGLSPKVKLEALMLSEMNLERAELCSGQPALKAFFEMNAKFLLEVAR